MKYISLFLFVVNLMATITFSQHSGFNLPGLTVNVNNNPSSGLLFLGATDSINHLIILDNDLVPVFYKRFSSGSNIYDFKLQPNGKLTYNIYPQLSYGMTNSGIVDKQFITPPGYRLDVHDLQVMEDNTYYVLGIEHTTVDMSQYVTGGDTAALLLTHTIHHMDANDNELWRWYAFDHYDIMDVDDAVDLTQHVIDWTHCNSIDIAPDGNIILSTRNFDEITKINSQTGDIIWRFGGKRNQFQFISDLRGFNRQHDARILTSGNLAMFDNGHLLIPEYSSYVEYEMDEQNLTATLARRYSRNGSIFSQVRGGIQEFSNGNILISWDNLLNPFISEINPEDSTVYEVTYDNFTHQYRAYKFIWETDLFYPEHDSLDFGTVHTGQQAGIELKLYNSNDDTVFINEIYNIDSSFYVDEVLPLIIPPHSNVDATIIFAPFKQGNFADKINFRNVSDSMLIARQVFVTGMTEPVSVKEEMDEISGYSLLQNYPNPFNSVTTFSYLLPSTSNVVVNVFNSLGERIAQLVSKIQITGEYNIKWNAENNVSGVYFYSIDATPLDGSEHYNLVRKMILLK